VASIEDSNVREFLSSLKPSKVPPFIRGVIIAINVTNNTVSCTIGGGLTEISDLRRARNYSPIVGDEVIILVNGPDKIVAFALA
jgi:hypothetical protein